MSYAASRSPRGAAASDQQLQHQQRLLRQQQLQQQQQRQQQQPQPQRQPQRQQQHYSTSALDDSDGGSGGVVVVSPFDDDDDGDRYRYGDGDDGAHDPRGHSHRGHSRNDKDDGDDSTGFHVPVPANAIGYGNVGGHDHDDDGYFDGDDTGADGGNSSAGLNGRDDGFYHGDGQRRPHPRSAAAAGAVSTARPTAWSRARARGADAPTLVDRLAVCMCSMQGLLLCMVLGACFTIAFAVISTALLNPSSAGSGLIHITPPAQPTMPGVPASPSQPLQPATPAIEPVDGTVTPGTDATPTPATTPATDAGSVGGVTTPPATGTDSAPDAATATTVPAPETVAASELTGPGTQALYTHPLLAANGATTGHGGAAVGTQSLASAFVPWTLAPAGSYFAPLSSALARAVTADSIDAAAALVAAPAAASDSTAGSVGGAPVYTPESALSSGLFSPSDSNGQYLHSVPKATLLESAAALRFAAAAASATLTPAATLASSAVRDAALSLAASVPAATAALAGDAASAAAVGSQSLPGVAAASFAVGAVGARSGAMALMQSLLPATPATPAIAHVSYMPALPAAFAADAALAAAAAAAVADCAAVPASVGGDRLRALLALQGVTATPALNLASRPLFVAADGAAREGGAPALPSVAGMLSAAAAGGIASAGAATGSAPAAGSSPLPTVGEDWLLWVRAPNGCAALSLTASQRRWLAAAGATVAREIRAARALAPASVAESVTAAGRKSPVVADSGITLWDGPWDALVSANATATRAAFESTLMTALLTAAPLFNATVADPAMATVVSSVMRAFTGSTAFSAASTDLAAVTAMAWQLDAPEALAVPVLPATVPGTVVSTIAEQGPVKNPLYGTNLQCYPDISTTGRGAYSGVWSVAFPLTNPANASEATVIVSATRAVTPPQHATRAAIPGVAFAATATATSASASAIASSSTGADTVAVDTDGYAWRVLASLRAGKLPPVLSRALLLSPSAASAASSGAAQWGAGRVWTKVTAGTHAVTGEMYIPPVTAEEALAAVKNEDCAAENGCTAYYVPAAFPFPSLAAQKLAEALATARAIAAASAPVANNTDTPAAAAAAAAASNSVGEGVIAGFDSPDLIAPMLAALATPGSGGSAALSAAIAAASHRAAAPQSAPAAPGGARGGQRVWLLLRGVSYRAHAALNGVALAPLPDADGGDAEAAVGMFRRAWYDLTPAVAATQGAAATATVGNATAVDVAMTALVRYLATLTREERADLISVATAATTGAHTAKPEAAALARLADHLRVRGSGTASGSSVVTSKSAPVPVPAVFSAEFYFLLLSHAWAHHAAAPTAAGTEASASAGKPGTRGSAGLPPHEALAAAARLLSSVSAGTAFPARALPSAALAQQAGAALLSGAVNSAPPRLVTRAWASLHRLSVAIEPVPHPDTPGSQGGRTKSLGRSVNSQYTGGWDWIEGTPDRNTGPWDDVSLRYTGNCLMRDPHVWSEGHDSATAATVRAEVELLNASPDPIVVHARYTVRSASGTNATSEVSASVPVLLAAYARTKVVFPPQALVKPRLWWPHGHGEQHLYAATFNCDDVSVPSAAAAAGAKGASTAATSASAAAAAVDGLYSAFLAAADETLARELTPVLDRWSASPAVAAVTNAPVYLLPAPAPAMIRLRAGAVGQDPLSSAGFMAWASALPAQVAPTVSEAGALLQSAMPSRYLTRMPQTAPATSYAATYSELAKNPLWRSLPPAIGLASSLPTLAYQALGYAPAEAPAGAALMPHALRPVFGPAGDAVVAAATRSNIDAVTARVVAVLPASALATHAVRNAGDVPVLTLRVRATVHALLAPIGGGSGNGPAGASTVSLYDLLTAGLGPWSTSPLSSPLDARPPTDAPSAAAAVSATSAALPPAVASALAAAVAAAVAPLGYLQHASVATVLPLLEHVMRAHALEQQNQVVRPTQAPRRLLAEALPALQLHRQGSARGTFLSHNGVLATSLGGAGAGNLVQAQQRRAGQSGAGDEAGLHGYYASAASKPFVSVTAKLAAAQSAPYGAAPSPASVHKWPARYAPLVRFHAAKLSVRALAAAGLPAGSPGAAAVSDSQTVRFGVRDVHVANARMPAAQSPAPLVLVNGKRIYTRGGNWIASDQLLRGSSDRQRYFDEVQLHRDGGINMIRIWGGATAERPEFYEACDELGVMVWQDFWQSGDVNGRWGGRYEWPDDHSLYIASIRDTVRLLRTHPSLVIWCAGNEIDPIDRSPQPSIRAAMFDAIWSVRRDDSYLVLDSGSPATARRLFLSSTSGGNSLFAFAPADGPYDVQTMTGFYGGSMQFRMPFNPELGSSGTPSALSLRQMLAPADHVPPPQGANANGASRGWVFHKFIQYYDTARVDHVYQMHTPASTPTTAALSTADARAVSRAEHLLFPNTVLAPPPAAPLDVESDGEGTGTGGDAGMTMDRYATSALMVNLMQHRAIIENTQAHAFTRHSGVVLWKSQGPWPHLRGGLYDYYLSQQGALYGTRHAGEQLHVQFDYGYSAGNSNGPVATLTGAPANGVVLRAASAVSEGDVKPLPAPTAAETALATAAEAALEAAHAADAKRAATAGSVTVRSPPLASAADGAGRANEQLVYPFANVAITAATPGLNPGGSTTRKQVQLSLFTLRHGWEAAPGRALPYCALSPKTAPIQRTLTNAAVLVAATAGAPLAGNSPLAFAHTPARGAIPDALGGESQAALDFWAGKGAIVGAGTVYSAPAPPVVEKSPFEGIFAELGTVVRPSAVAAAQVETIDEQERLRRLWRGTQDAAAAAAGQTGVTPDPSQQPGQGQQQLQTGSASANSPVFLPALANATAHGNPAFSPAVTVDAYTAAWALQPPAAPRAPTAADGTPRKAALAEVPLRAAAVPVGWSMGSTAGWTEAARSPWEVPAALPVDSPAVAPGAAAFAHSHAPGTAGSSSVSTGAFHLYLPDSAIEGPHAGPRSDEPVVAASALTVTYNAHPRTCAVWADREVSSDPRESPVRQAVATLDVLEDGATQRIIAVAPMGVAPESPQLVATPVPASKVTAYPAKAASELLLALSGTSYFGPTVVPAVPRLRVASGASVSSRPESRPAYLRGAPELSGAPGGLTRGSPYFHPITAVNNYNHTSPPLIAVVRFFELDPDAMYQPRFYDHTGTAGSARATAAAAAGGPWRSGFGRLLLSVTTTLPQTIAPSTSDIVAAIGFPAATDPRSTVLVDVEMHLGDVPAPVRDAIAADILASATATRSRNSAAGRGTLGGHVMRTDPAAPFATGKAAGSPLEPAVEAYLLALWRARAEGTAGASLPLVDVDTGLHALGMSRQNGWELHDCSDEDGVRGMRALTGQAHLPSVPAVAAFSASPAATAAAAAAVSDDSSALTAGLAAQPSLHPHAQRALADELIAGGSQGAMPCVAASALVGSGLYDYQHTDAASTALPAGLVPDAVSAVCPVRAPAAALSAWQAPWAMAEGSAIIGAVKSDNMHITAIVPSLDPNGALEHRGGGGNRGGAGVRARASPPAPVAAAPLPALTRDEVASVGMWRVCTAYLNASAGAQLGQGKPSARLRFPLPSTATAASVARIYRPTLLSRSQYFLNTPAVHSNSHAVHPALARLRRSPHAWASVNGTVTHTALLPSLLTPAALDTAAARAGQSRVVATGAGALTPAMLRARVPAAVGAALLARAETRLFGNAPMPAAAHSRDVVWTVRLEAPRRDADGPPRPNEIATDAAMASTPAQALPLPGAQNLAFNVEVTVLRPGVTLAHVASTGSGDTPPEELRLLPAQVSDGHFSLLPGEPHLVTVRVRREIIVAAVASAAAAGGAGAGEAAAGQCGSLMLQGWNLKKMLVPLPCVHPAK